MTRQSLEELSNHLQEQTDFLRSSGDAFDRGDLAEAKRLATQIRVLVHDTGRSTSLLEEWSVKNQVRYFDTSRPIDPANLVATQNLVMVRMSSPGTSKYIAAKEGGPVDRLRLASFDEWWTEPIVKDDQHNLFSRKDLVLALAHKEGGAHVDPELPAAYAALSRSNSLGWIVSENALSIGGAPGPESHAIEGNPVLFMVRQIAHELEYTIRFSLACLFPPRFEGQ